jgi:argininosuccinate lyase
LAVVTTEKPWGGRFLETTDREVVSFTASIHYDRRLYRCDIEGSIAHARMLARQGIIAPGEATKIRAGLKAILADIEAGVFVFSPEDEDIHMAIEKALIARIGEVGGKLHTGRSRNDQVALDIRLYLRAEVRRTIELIRALKAALLEKAKAEIGRIMPGYTHLQKAQPVLLSHYYLAFREMFERDEGRLRDCCKRFNVLPLGSAALAGTSLPLDRRYVARLLRFPAVTENSMDGVSDRDFIAEYLFAASLVMMHLSRFCEDLILWSTDEFGYVEISDAFTTGSSIMPQKKNPDVAELIRGKTGRVYGNLVALLTILKGLPMTYNRDLQEDKEPLFDTVDTLQASLGILTAMIGRLSFRPERMEAGAEGGFSTATDVAEYLVLKGVPFREAHGVVGRLVAWCIREKKPLTGLTLAEFRTFHPAFADDVFARLTVRQSVDARKTIGGTAEETVRSRIAALEAAS